MGAGRKTESYTLPEKHQQVSTTANNSGNARNLRKNDLGGVIFGCTHYTMEECLSNQIFGLPSAHFSYIKNIKPGLPLFLFNYSDRKLHGIYEAASPGQMNINPYGWSKNDAERTRYPAQVRVQMRKQCQPLTEKQFKKVISGNYYTQVHFQFELDHAQTCGLISLFEFSPMSGSVVSWVPKAAPKWQSPLKPIFNHDKKLEKKLDKQDSWPSVSDDDFAQSDHLNTETWSQTLLPHSSSKWDVLRDSLDTDASNEGEDGDEDSRPSTSENAVPCFDQTNVESGTSCPTPCVDEDNVEVENDEELVYRKLKQLVLDKECSKSHPIGDEENVVPCETNVTPLEYDCAPEVPLLSDKENVVPCEANVTPLEYDCAPEASLFSAETAEKYEEVSINSSYLQALINQLRQEVDELKASSLEQRQKTLLLERKLTDTGVQVQQLTIRVKDLESQLVPSSTYVDETSNQPTVICETSEESFDKPSLCANELVYIIGGYDGNSWLSALDCYSPSTDSMKSLKPMSSFRSYASAAALNGDIYIFGGGDGGNMWYDTVESYSPLRNEWTPCPSLIQKKGSLAGATLHDKIYAIGGGDGIECFSDVEMFDPAVGRWIGTQSMLQKRFSSAAVELNGVIYTAGGFDGHNYLKSAERFDPREVVSWSQLPNMNTSRACHSLVVLNEKLYAVGGYDGTRMIPSIEVFDPRMDSWIAGDEMKESRGYSIAAVIRESIFVISGLKEGRNMTDTVEFYKEGHGWSVANMKGVGKRCFCSGVTL